MNVFRRWDRPRKVKLTVRDFLCLDDAGAFRDYAKTELIEGEIVGMNAQFAPHARFKSNLFRRLADAVDEVLPGFSALSEVAVSIPPLSMPEPDIIVTDFRETGRQAIPVETVVLIVEVADTTLRFDLGKKSKLYAAARVPEYWVADLEAGKLHQFSSPSDKGYCDKLEFELGDTVEAVTITGLRVDTKRA